MTLATIDLWIIALYAVFIIGLAQWVAREEDGKQKDAGDYFLASKSLPWWAIGASLIAANISAEQIIGMSGSGYALGLAIASYEWMAALTLLIVGKYLLPIFLEKGIYTMPQYLEQRYDARVRLIMAIFWLSLYIIVNLTAILWLGALAINTVTGLALVPAMLLLAILAIAYSLYGGLKAVALTDIFQVVLLVAGGLIIAYISVAKVGGDLGFFAGFNQLTAQLPGHFDMILSKDNPFYKDLPGISVLVGGMWIMNLSYWGFNQYIIQRALAAESLKEAQKGIAFAAYLKLLMPVIVVLPGIAAVVLAPDLAAPDKAYPEMMNLLPTGVKGLVFAALIAAILSSLASMMNSISTIFTMDIYRRFKIESTEAELVLTGRVVAVLAITISLIIAKPLLGNFGQAFQFIQEFTGFFTPGIVVLFLMGMFWQRMTANAALFAALVSFFLSLVLKLAYPTLPFMDRVGVVFLVCLLLSVAISLWRPEPEQSPTDAPQNISYDTSLGFNVASLGVALILIALYATWW